MNIFDPTRSSFSPYGFTCVRWQPTLMPKPDRHNEIELNLLRSGQICYLRGGKKICVEAHQLNVFWAAIPHQIIDYSDVTDFYVATVPLAWFLTWQPPSHLLHQLLQGDMVREPDDRQTMDLNLFSRWVKDLECPTNALNKVVLLEMEARLLRLSHSARQSDSGVQSTAHGMNKVDEIAAFVARNYTQPLTVDDIGQAVALHPNYAMTVFKKSFGMTLIDYLTKLRISHAQHLLITTDSKILGISLSSGFATISRFNAAFREESGLTPREYRQRYRLNGIDR